MTWSRKSTGNARESLLADVPEREHRKGPDEELPEAGYGGWLASRIDDKVNSIISQGTVMLQLMYR